MAYDEDLARRVRELLAAWVRQGVEFARTLPPKG
jgi:hypothetical protein